MAGWGNSFSLLDEDETGEGAIRVPPKAVTPVVAKPAKEEPKATSKNNAVADNKKDTTRKPESGRGQQDRERRPPRAREERGDNQTSNNASEPSAMNGTGSPTAERGFRVRGTGDRSNNTERRVRGDAAGPGATRTRQYDRRSGTGRGREEKRGGAGRGNWGSDDQEIQEQTQQVEAGEAPQGTANSAWTTDGADWNPKVEGEGENTEAAAEEQPAKPPRELTEEEKQRQAERELEEKQMTLDEYISKKKSLDIALPPQRKAGEGEDEKQWAGFIAAKSEKQADDEEKSKKAAGDKKTKEAKKVPLPADLLKFKGEQQRRDQERRERPPRDGDRFPRREREDRPPRTQNARPAKAGAEFNAADPSSFPALKV